MNLQIRCACGLLLLASISLTLAAEPEEMDFKDELPRIPPVAPDKALETFTLHPQFHIQQVAAEPLVFDPVAMAFDEDGRLYVVEMRDYSEHPEGATGRIRRLVDTNGDGIFDQATVYAEGLSWPTAVICFDGGIFVGAPPHIYYCKDTDGDGRADEQKIVMTGFGRGNVQGLMNSFRWGLDNRIHGATSSSGAKVTWPEYPDRPGVVTNGRDFAFNPRTLELEATSGGGQHGMSFDKWGRKFVCSNSNHIQQVMFEDRYIARNPHLAAPGPRRMIAVDGPQAPVFRTSPVEPWRIVRTRLRVAGTVRGPVEGGGTPAGYFTGATGVTIYTGDAWPEEFRGNPIIGDVGSNIVHRKLLTLNGLEYTADRARPETEFVASKDIWFRPAQFANAPDGTLYIADVYREVIEHPASLPPIIKKHLDTDSGNDRGRIYRVLPEGFQQRPLPKLSSATSEELVATLGHTNTWHRETAQRLLYERQDRAAIAPLEKLAAQCDLPEGRMHALYALAGQQALTPEVLLVALQDENPHVRRHAVRLSEPLLAASPILTDKLYEMVSDEDVAVQYQLAFTLGELSGPRRAEALAELARRQASDPWVTLAILSSLYRQPEAVFTRLVEDEAFRQTKPGTALLGRIAQLVGKRGKADEVASLLSSTQSLPDGEAQLRSQLLQQLSGALAKSGAEFRDQLSSNSGAGKLLDDLVTQALDRAKDRQLSPEVRTQAAGLLALTEFETARPILQRLLEPAEPESVQRAALNSLARFRQPQVAQTILAAWPTFTPQVRGAAAEVLLARSERIQAVLDAIEQEKLRITDLDPARLKLLRDHQDPQVAARAKQVLGSLKLARRADVVAAYQDALKIEGTPEKGHAVFKKICSACHKLENEGFEIGPNLATLRNRGPETILVNVLDPNREVNPQYVNYVAVTADGRSASGLISAETATSLTLMKDKGQKQTLLRVDIEELRSTGLSIMPEGMEKEIKPQDMADLIAYLMSLK